MPFSKTDRIKILAKYDGHCGYCGKVITMKDMQVDHMNPKSIKALNTVLFEDVMEDRTNHIDNLMPSCRRCNHYKRAETVEGFRRLLKTLHERLVSIYIVKVAIDFGIIKIRPFDGLFYFEKNQLPETCQSKNRFCCSLPSNSCKECTLFE